MNDNTITIELPDNDKDLKLFYYEQALKWIAEHGGEKESAIAKEALTREGIINQINNPSQLH